MAKTIDTLLGDIYSLLENGKEDRDPHNLDLLLTAIMHAVDDALEAPKEVEGPTSPLRLSKTGTPLRKLWYENKYASTNPTKVDGPNLMRFLTGHIMEAVLLYLAKEAGHTVEYAQIKVELEGVPGHLDCVIDGHLVDVKTASQYSYGKFEKGDIAWGNDPFGYVAQLSSYKKALENTGVELKDPSYFWAYNKSDSAMCLTEVSKAHIVDSEELLRKQKETLLLPKPPPDKCYPDQKYGEAGNMTINDQCNYCPFKRECHADANGGQGLRVFKYSKKPVYFTKIVKEPNVEEIT